MKYDNRYEIEEEDGLRMVETSENQWNLIDKNGNLILKENYYWIGWIDIDGLRIVRLSDNKWNLIDENGNLIFKENFIDISISGCDVNGNREINGKIWNYKTYLKQKLIKKLLD